MYSAVHGFKNLSDVLKCLRSAYLAREKDTQEDQEDQDTGSVFRHSPSELDYLEAAGKGALQTLTHAGAEIDYHIHQYAAPTCLAICEVMQEQLPRELRDMIYGFVLQDNPKLTLRDKDFENEFFDRRFIKPLASYRYDDEFDDEFYHRGYDNVFNYEHIFDPAFVDHITKYEFTEAWYKIATFSFTDASYISDFLHYYRYAPR
jgi:hypothetical protein